MQTNVLFVTWDGPQVNYLESLFAPIFMRLRLYGYKFHVLQFTWADPERLSRVQRACEEMDIPYRSVNILRWPSVSIGSVLTVLRSKKVLRRAIKDWKINILMPRATLPAWAIQRINNSLGLPVVFDSDGLPIDEKIEFGGMSVSSLAHRFLRDIEFRALHAADAVMVRSKDAAIILQERAGANFDASKTFVVGNGRDSAAFSPDNEDVYTHLKKSLGFNVDAPTIAYVGSLGGKYRFDQVLQFFLRLRLRLPGAQLLVLTPSPDLAREAISHLPRNEADSCAVRHVAGSEVPRYLSFVDLGLVFIEPSYSMRAVSPVKLGEYLLCGLPVVATIKNIGDSASYIAPEFGFAIDHVDESALDSASEWFFSLLSSGKLPLAKKNARDAGMKHFSIEGVLDAYVNCMAAASSRGNKK
ncbi:glycosyltransferase [Alloalcanivorax gelatiniphagus]|uniref:Glycosyltransferase family 4 protein n=1 Tax=Alloalcanivorax gelatiniphagus TaxID=1194167 RepID=A0ABY2XP33_9GAMM|nr:glycosyltransferase [Alloalcanivorax gelatiniphagus]TMW13630.1 glycosyltransferase family 4 protein [Alloalcanivorax gelatiniphagus]